MRMPSLAAAFAGCLLPCAVCVMPISTAAAAQPSIDQLTWHQRLLIVFAATDQSTPLAKQRAIALEAKTDFSERDLVLIQVVGNAVHGASDSAEVLRRHYGVAANTFRALLIGKDGGVKVNSPEPIPAAQLFATIDAMPMRQQEKQR